MLPMYWEDLPPFLTMEYWNFLFSLANCFGMDSKHSRILDLSASSAYLTISSSYPAIRLRCFLYMSSIFLVSRKQFTTSGSPPTITYLYSSSIIALWIPSGTAFSFSKHDLTESITASPIPFAHRNSSKSNGYISITVSYPTGTESCPTSSFFFLLWP